MKTYTLIVLLLAAAVLGAGCTDKTDDAEAWNETLAQKAAGGTAAADAPAAAAAPHAAAPAGPAQPAGEVVETFDSGGYTYVRLKTPDGEIWAAGPVCDVAVGSDVTLEGAMVMRDFAASSLDRTFAEIWFASAIRTGPPAADADFADELQRAHGRTAAPATDLDVSAITPPDGGVSIAGLYAARGDYAGRRVKLRGKVVKSLDGIMGRNWLHLQDGTGDAAAGDHDITVTTDDTARRGDTVVVEGVVALDRDFGSGYVYSVIVENATVKVEKTL